jgi:ABC-type uncharacterized transport system involved in gliding motility auxiliary subunit
MTQATQRQSRGQLNMAVTITATVAIAAFANLLLSGTRLRTDLTENSVNVLSEASQEAAAALDDLEVRVYISPDLPESVPMGQGRDAALQGIPQKLLDKLSEYQAWAPSMVVTRVQDDLIGEAERNRLRPFTGKGGALSESGRFEFKRYVLGLTMHWRNQTEVFELALEPAHYEFEITRRLVRLKEKAEFAVTMKDVIEAALAIGDATKACVAALEKGQGEEAADPLALLGGEGADKQLKGLRAEAKAIGEACAKLAGPLGKAKDVTSTLEAFSRVQLIADALRQESDSFLKGLEGPEANAAQLTQQLGRLIAIGKAVDEEVRDVEDAPGQKRIGFVCNARAFCPFPEDKPLYQRELAQGMGGQNGMMQQALGFLDRLDEQITMLLQQINQGFFRGRGFDTVRVDLDADLPDDLAALVVYGPSGDFTDWQLHQLDQFVLRGGSLIAFLQPWDVGLQLMGRGNQPEKPSMTKRSSNLAALLEHYGLKPTGALVVEPKQHGEVALMQFLQQGDRLIPFQSVPLPYPMLPTFKDMDGTDPLVRSTPSMTLPFTTWFELKPSDGVTTSALVSSSAEAASVDSADFPLDPELQVAEALKAPVGKPLPVIATARGTFTSYFKGKTTPTKPQAPKADGDDAKKDDKPGAAEKPDLAAGEGRVLAIGSGLGLTSLARDVIFEGFKPEDALSQDGGLFMKLEDYRLRFENWSTRLDQVQHTLQGNLQFLQNALDWSVQRGAVAELRSKQYTERPLSITDPDEAGLERALGISLAPALLVGFGLIWSARRKARIRRLSA